MYVVGDLDEVFTLNGLASLERRSETQWIDTGGDYITLGQIFFKRIPPVTLAHRNASLSTGIKTGI